MKSERVIHTATTQDSLVSPSRYTRHDDVCGVMLYTQHDDVCSGMTCAA
jgi:hypothetical protein